MRVLHTRVTTRVKLSDATLKDNRHLIKCRATSFNDFLYSNKCVKKVYWKQYTELCGASSVAVVDILHLINIRGVALVNK